MKVEGVVCDKFINLKVTPAVMRKPPLLETDADFRACGGTPEQLIGKYPGKCLAELLNEPGIFLYLYHQAQGMDRLLRTPEVKNSTRIHFLENMLLDLRYLQSVNRLPTEFEGRIKQYQDALEKCRAI